MRPVTLKDNHNVVHPIKGCTDIHPLHIKVGKAIIMINSDYGYCMINKAIMVISSGSD